MGIFNRFNGTKAAKTRFQINNVIWFLTFNDVFIWGVYFVVTILVGLYISDKLGVSAIEVVAIGAGISYFIRGVTQVPIGWLGDKLKTDRDEIWMLMLGNFMMGLPVLLLTQITDVWHYYFLQAIFGLGSSLNIVDWRKLFAKNLDRGREGIEYAVYDTAMSLSIALLSVMSGSIAAISGYHFELVITTIGLTMIGSNVFILLIYMLNKPQLDAG